MLGPVRIVSVKRLPDVGFVAAVPVRAATVPPPYVWTSPRPSDSLRGVAVTRCGASSPFQRDGSPPAVAPGTPPAMPIWMPSASWMVGIGPPMPGAVPCW